jgi:ADP-heptose:LPS heptosyltransferase
LLSTPVFRSLKTSFPEARLTVVVRSTMEDLFRNHPFIDDVIVFHENILEWTLKRMNCFWKGLRKGYDLTVVLNTVSHSLSSDTMAYLSGAPYVLGSDHHVFTGCRRNFLYNLEALYDSDSKHQSEYNLDILRYIGVDTPDLKEEIGLDDEERRWAECTLNDLNEHNGRWIIGIHPGAGKVENRWPAERFAAVADQVQNAFEMSVVLFEGPKERHLVEGLASTMKTPYRVVRGMRLRQVAALFSCLDLLVCNDTGVMHLAASVGTPLVAVFGPTDPNCWKPWGENFVAVRGANGSVQSVDTSSVYQACAKLLKRKTVQ